MPTDTTAAPLAEALRERGFGRYEGQWYRRGSVRFRNGHPYWLQRLVDDPDSPIHYKVTFRAETPLSVILAAVDAALAEAGG